MENEGVDEARVFIGHLDGGYSELIGRNLKEINIKADVVEERGLCVLSR